MKTTYLKNKKGMSGNQKGMNGRNLGVNGMGCFLYI